MPSRSIERLVDARLRDPDFLQVQGNVSSEAMQAVRQALFDMPEPALKTFLKSKEQIVLGDYKALRNFCHEHSLGDLKRRTGAVQLPAGAAPDLFNGRPVMLLRTDKSPEDIRKIMRHEAGHALDHINNGYSGLGSTRSPRFMQAADDYLAQKRGAPATEAAFHGDRSFRRGHIINYDPGKALYAELSAEMFNKFSARAAEHGAAEADRFMKENYLQAWDVYKEEVVPQVGAYIRANRAPGPERRNAPERQYIPQPEREADPWADQRERIQGYRPAVGRPEPRRLEIGPKDQARNLGRRIQDHFGESFVPSYAASDDGRLRLLAPDTFSRGRLAEIGLNPERLTRHSGNAPAGKVFIEIPSAEVQRIAGSSPPNMRKNFQHAATDNIGVPARAPRGLGVKIVDAIKNVGHRSGVVGGAGLGVIAAGATYAMTGNRAEAADAGLDIVIPYREAALAYADGDIEKADRSATSETASLVGTGVGATVATVGVVAAGMTAWPATLAVGGAALAGGVAGSFVEDASSIRVPNPVVLAVNSTDWTAQQLADAFSGSASPPEPMTAREARRIALHITEEDLYHGWPGEDPPSQALFELRRYASVQHEFNQRFDELAGNGELEAFLTEIEPFAERLHEEDIQRQNLITAQNEILGSYIEGNALWQTKGIPAQNLNS